jgi:hypothetical protein
MELEFDSENRRVMLDMVKTDLHERVRFSVTFADNALKALMLVNGGAIIGLFTFIGNTAGKPGLLAMDATGLWVAFGVFVAGLVLALVAHLGAYASQDLYMRVSHAQFLHLTDGPTSTLRSFNVPPRLYRWGHVAQYGALLFAVASLIAFCVGSACALAAVLPAA